MSADENLSFDEWWNDFIENCHPTKNDGCADRLLLFARRLSGHDKQEFLEGFVGVVKQHRFGDYLALYVLQAENPELYRQARDYVA